LSFILLRSLLLVFITSASASISSSHFSESSIAILRVAGIFAKIIFMITIIGTERSIPVIPQIVHQKARARIITSGLKFNLFPTNFGSIIFHINICTPMSPLAININE